MWDHRPLVAFGRRVLNKGAFAGGSRSFIEVAASQV